jgi:hypothetical protein
MKKKSLSVNEYLDRFLRRENIVNLSQYKPRGLYYAKRLDGMIVFIGFVCNHYNMFTPSEHSYVRIKIDRDQHRPEAEDEGDDNLWGLLQYDSGMIISAYRGYHNTRKKWSATIEDSGLGYFVRLIVQE